MADDPLASLAKAAQQAQQAKDHAREAEQEARTSEEAARKRLVRSLSIGVALAVIAGTLVFLGPRVADPYYGEDPLEDPRRAKAYVGGLLDQVSAWRASHGQLPQSLEQAVPDSRLPPRGAAYRVEYRIENGVPVLTLQGGREPLVVRGK